MRVTLGVLLLGAAALTGCSHAMQLAAVEDAETVMRVKTTLVNDPVLGVFPIEVRVTGGVAVLTGGVGSEEDVARAVELVRSVVGVADVRSELRVGVETLPPSALQPPQGSTLAFEEPDLTSLVAVGASIRRADTTNEDLSSSIAVGPLIRLGSGSGFGLAIGFNWTRTDLSGPGGRGSLGCLNVRPVMAGVGYTVRGRRVSASLSVVGGTAFNSLCSVTRSSGPTWALAVRRSAALRTGVSTWIELNRRFAANVFTGFLFTRPQVTVLTNGVPESYRLKAESAHVSVGLVYKLF